MVKQRRPLQKSYIPQSATVFSLVSLNHIDGLDFGHLEIIRAKITLSCLQNTVCLSSTDLKECCGGL